MMLQTMAPLLHLFALTTIIILSNIPISSSSSSSAHGLSRGSSLSAENKHDLLVSPNRIFTAGFHQVGDNAYTFSVWFTEQLAASETRTLVWTANRDKPVNGKRSKLSLWKDGNLVLTDAGQYIIWSTQTESKSSKVQLELYNTGNLVLQELGKILWQSFDYPTDTLLPHQPLTRNTQLVSSRSRNNHSSGFYKLFFDNDSILRLLYNGPETTSIYWPDPRSPRLWTSGRFEYIEKRRASLDSNGGFNSSDGFGFVSADYGSGAQRIMKIDTDGNLRVYSLVKQRKAGMKWVVQWQAISHTCRINGACGPSSLCTYSQDSGRKCTCLHGHKMVNSQEWSYGCEPKFKMCKGDDCNFIKLRYTEFYGYDIRMLLNGSLDACKKGCLQDSSCVGFNLGWKTDKGYYYCFLKSFLNNGYQNGVYGTMYIKLPKRLVLSFDKEIVSETRFSCRSPVVTSLIRSYKKIHDTKPLGLLILFGCVVGFIEIMCILFFYYFSSKQSSRTEEMYFPASTGFRKFTYSELKKATRNFREEIGRGGGSVVYKAQLKDNRIAAIKKLKNTNHQGEAEFQAEISTIGKVNHMNLIETWGYCAQGKHRLVVYEYMEKGALANNLELDWATRFDIAVGTAKGLAYLHEECLEWVLHCDVKPHNILLDGNYNPKVADFGLCKWSDRGADQWDFSMMRGTRGYMAPEWVLNLPITSKVDVFSYGVVILEMITGRNPISNHHTSNENGETLIHWVRNQAQTESWVEEIIDPTIKGEYDPVMMENLVRVALQCTQEDREARPTMSQVVNMLLHA